MANTPKSVRQHNKASAVTDRWFEISYAHLEEDGHPAHQQAAAAFDRESRALAHTNRDYRRYVRREIKGGKRNG